MIGADEIASSIRGAFRLAAFDANGLALFNRTPEGFWRSFVAAILVAPGYLIIAGIAPEPGVAPEPNLHDVLVGWIAYVILWIAFPVAMEPISRLLGRQDSYVGYIVAYNWGAVPKMAVFLVAALAVWALRLGDAGSNFVGGVAFIAILIYCWFIARTALNIDAFAAVGVVAIDFVLRAIIGVIPFVFGAAPSGVAPT